MKTIKIKKGKTKMIAHRGLSGLERENTMRAFAVACNKSHYGTECDIHYTKDHKLVICHNATTGSFSDDDYVISETDYSKISQVRLYEKGTEKPACDLVIPLFEDYLLLHQRYNKHMFIEIKFKMTEEEASEILQIIKPYYKLVTFISFHYDNLILIRNFDKDIPLALLTSKFDDNLIEKCLKYNLGIDIFYQELNKERIDLFHANDIIVNAWTINDKNVAQELISYGIDFITTDILE